MLGSDSAATAAIQAEKGRHGSCRVDRDRAGRKRENLESNGQKALFNLVSVGERCQSVSVRSTNQPEAVETDRSILPSHSFLAFPSSHSFLHCPYFLVSDLLVVAFLPQLRRAETLHSPGENSQTKRPSSEPVISKRQPAYMASTCY